MAWVNPKTNWAGADGVAAADMNRIEENERMLRTTLSVYETAGGTGTAITLSNVDLTAGASKTFVAALPNGGAATTINGVRVYMPGNNADPTFVAGYAYTVWYSGVSFFVKASAVGNATASKVLAPYTFSANGIIGGVGTIQSITGDTVAGMIVQQNGRLYMQPPIDKYWPTNGFYTFADSADFLEANIVSGKNIFGKVGTALTRKVASGSVTSDSGNTIYNYADGGVVGRYSITVSGLSFTPLIILAVYIESGYEYVAIYNAFTNIGASKEFHTYITNSNYYSGGSPENFKADVGGYVVNGGFKMPVTRTGKVYSWLAFG